MQSQISETGLAGEVSHARDGWNVRVEEIEVSWDLRAQYWAKLLGKAGLTF